MYIILVSLELKVNIFFTLCKIIRSVIEICINILSGFLTYFPSIHVYYNWTICLSK